MRPFITALVLAAALGAPAGLVGQETTDPPLKIKRHPDLISLEEIAALPPDVRNAHEIVARLRPNWFTIRGQSTLTQRAMDVVGYVNGVRRGGPSALKEVDRLQILEIRHLRGSEASLRFGMDHEHGAVLVQLKTK